MPFTLRIGFFCNLVPWFIFLLCRKLRDLGTRSCPVIPLAAPRKFVPRGFWSIKMATALYSGWNKPKGPGKRLTTTGVDYVLWGVHIAEESTDRDLTDLYWCFAEQSGAIRSLPSGFRLGEASAGVFLLPTEQDASPSIAWLPPAVCH